MASFLIDTNVLVGILRGHEGTHRLWSRLLTEGDLCISVITYLEIIAGMRPHEESMTYDVLSALPVLPVDAAVADQAGRLVARYRAQGVTLDIADAAVAATALLHSLTIVTYNSRHFPMPELALYAL